MKRVTLCLIIGLVCFISQEAFAVSYASAPRILVVEGQYDGITSVLEQYRFHHTVISASELATTDWTDSCDLLFVPCGFGPGIDRQMQILVSGTSLQGVALSPDYKHIDEKKIRESLRSFVGNGGSAYFDDFSVTTMAKTWPGVSFYKNFAHLGLPGTVTANALGSAPAFGCSEKQRLNFSHSGWVVVSQADRFESWMEARVPTAIGDRPAVLAGWRTQDKGALYFSVFHQADALSLPVRFVMMQALHRAGLEKLRRELKCWELEPGTLLFDRSLPTDSMRCFNVQVQKGSNSLFFAPASGSWQLDILTTQGMLLYSRSVVRGQTWIDFESPEARVELRVFPLDREAYRSFGVATATGLRLFPRVRLWAGLGLAVLLVAVWFVFIRKARFTGRPRGVWFNKDQG